MKTPEGTSNQDGRINDPAKAEAMASVSDMDHEGAAESRRDAEDPSWNPEKREEFRRRAKFLESRADTYEEGAKIQFETTKEVKRMTTEEREKIRAEVAAEAEIAYREMVDANESGADDAKEKNWKYEELSHRLFAIDKVIHGETIE